MAEHQGPRRHAWCQILVHGQDISTRLYPYLISVQVIDNLEGGTDECHIELDDRNGELQIPPDGAELQVCLGWQGEGPRLPDVGRESAAGGQGIIRMSKEEQRQEARFGGPGLQIVFDGWVVKVESGFGRRGGGRRLWIDGEGVNSKGLAKEVQNTTFGEGKPDDSEDSGEKGKVPLKDVMTKVFGAAGLQVAISPEMEKIARDFWSVNDSPMNFGKRIAQETGGLFKISKSTAVLIGKIEGVNAAGEAMPTIDAVWGINLIGWRIKPYVGRTQWGNAQSQFFDTHKGLWTPVKAAISGGTPFGGTQAIAHAVNSVADKATGEQTNSGASGDSKSSRGTGWVLFNGEPNAKANGFIRIEGARPGIDGTYTMTEVEHNYTRGVGFTTRANVKNPKGTGGGMDWVQSGDTPEAKANRDAAYEAREATNDPDSLTPVLPDETGGESWQPGDDPDSLTPPFTPAEPPPFDPGESWEPEGGPGESWEPDGTPPVPRPGEPGAPDVPISDREPIAPNVPISQMLYVPGGSNRIR
jgi:uncharacterized protein